jgi:hypothetical protein
LRGAPNRKRERNLLSDNVPTLPSTHPYN